MSSIKPPKNSIVIFGCGISGMLTAIALSRAGIKSHVVEKKSLEELTYDQDIRTTALNQFSRNFFEKIDVWARLEKYISSINEIYVCQNKSDNIFKMEGSHFPLGYMIPNIDFKNSLIEIIRNDPNIRLSCDSIYQNIQLSDYNISYDRVSGGSRFSEVADLCIAADGKFSSLRGEFFTEFVQKDYRQTAIVFNIKHELSHDAGAIEHFLPRGSFATLPLVNRFESSIVWVEETDIASFYLSRSKNFLAKQISDFTGGSLGDIEIISRIESYPLSAFCSKEYYNKRLMLVADSAHSIHPLAGQGLNMGIKDIESITSLIIKYNSLGLLGCAEMAKEYQRQRGLDNYMMFKITDSINGIFTSKISFVNEMTKVGLSIINKASFLQRLLIDYAKGKRSTLTS
ncbi:MAG: FAD-dependent monooxygenase [Rickettsiaceae bacterium]|nr:FAD-dependent monooxygenase [Rickettsiaceae bacterium]